MKKGRVIAIVALMCLASLMTKAENHNQKPYTTLTYGLEWSYVETFGSFNHLNFYSDEGSRVDIKGSHYYHKSEAEVYFHVGANLNKNWNIALYGGYTKIAHLYYAIPISIRGTRLFKTNTLNDRWLAYIEAGTGVALTKIPGPIFNTRYGCGYRFSLSRRSKLDIVASYRLIYSRPEINYYGEIIPAKSINRNNSWFSSMTIGLSITL